MDNVQIFEVGPRDGFQNLAAYIPLETKLEIIGRMAAAGIKHIQHTSFVSPKAVPQMRDSKEVARGCLERHPGIDFSALVPNLFGARAAWETGVRKVSFVVSLSASHNKANINRTHGESFEELVQIKEAYPDMGVCLDLATAFGCPFEGTFPARTVVDFLKPYAALGIRTANLCDTIGIANPRQVREVVAAIKLALPGLDLMVHIHDTRNMGMVNTLAAVESGVDKIQSTLGGLGGCPFAPGASGNLATEDVVFMLNAMGMDTGIDFEKLLEAAQYEKSVIGDGVFSGHHVNIKTKPCA